MAISGEARKPFESAQLRTGVFVGKVVAINPDREEFKDVLGIELKEDSKATEYVGESKKENNPTVRIDVWSEIGEGEDKEYKKVSFFLENKVKQNKDGNKTQFINNIGGTSWAVDEASLSEKFKKREVREAFVGEEDLYKFLRTWVNLDYSKADTELFLDFKKLIKGNVKELKELIGTDLVGKVGQLATVKVVQKEDGENKEYQGVYNRAFFPEYSLKFFRLMDYGKEEVQASLRKKDYFKDLKAHERFVVDVTNPEYGCKEHYVLKDIKDYNPEDNFVASDKALDPADSEY